ncbi:MAG TPA: GMC family oxidoreductase N-terminal domain-containing protein [Streptosporangiaceae bacterium]|nr:GMC family oxidoreductase N-terminal domain-containing protein [Streptosporangiaceae bacterium]
MRQPLDPHSVTTADYVIVGAGSAGCVLAERLSADENTEVVLLEAGGPQPERNPEIQVPVLFPRTFGSTLDWGFTTVPQAGLNGRVIPIPRGRALGGSSAINAQLWTRGHPADYDGWEAAGSRGWGSADVQPYFEKAEKRIRLAGIRCPAPCTADFLSACAQAGHAPAAEQPEGYGLARATHKDGLRWSSADGYLTTARHRPNLIVLTGSLVRKVLFTGTRACGVELETGESVHQIRAGREVILAAGAVGSPHLLMLSGIGPAGHLAEHGIPVLVDAREVGQNLTDHLIVPLAFAARGFESPGADAGPEEIQQYLKDRAGPLGSIISEALLFVRTRQDLDAPDVEIVHLVIPYGEHQTAARHGLALGVIVLRPASRGAVTLATADPHDAPLLDPRYLSDSGGADLDTAIAGVRQAQQILEKPVFARWRGESLTPGAMSGSSADIARYIRRTGLSIHHLVSTCRMGPDPQAPVDLSLRVRGTSGLRVADASAMPSLVRAHTHAPVTMLAERASALILGRG